jgi:hypothetical protein
MLAKKTPLLKAAAFLPSISRFPKGEPVFAKATY